METRVARLEAQVTRLGARLERANATIATMGGQLERANATIAAMEEQLAASAAREEEWRTSEAHNKKLCELAEEMVRRRQVPKKRNGEWVFDG